MAQEQNRPTATNATAQGEALGSPRTRRSAHELVPFLAVWAVQYQHDYGLNGLHPVHYDLMKKYGARMDDFERATNAKQPA